MSHNFKRGPYLPGVSVVVVLHGNVLDSCSVRRRLHEGFDVFEEPRLVPLPNLVQLVRLAAVNHVARHQDRPVFVKHQTLHKLVALSVARRPLKLLK